MKSIRRQLLIGLSAGALLCTAMAAVATYHQTREEVDELGELQLRQVAASVPSRLSTNLDLQPPGDPEEFVLVQAWDQAGKWIYSSNPAMSLPHFPNEGFKSVTVAGVRWRVYGVLQDDRPHARFVQVAQPVSVRQELAAEIAWRILWPMLFLVPVLGAMIYLVVKRTLAPLERVAKAVAGRAPGALQPLDGDDLPAELRPIIAALNDLLGRIDHAMTLQSNFVADAAHELRSPLTALKLQMQLAERAGSDEARAVAFGKLHERLDRATHLVQQLLTLARHEPGQVRPTLVPVDLHQLAQQAVGDQSTYAESKAIDLGVDAEQSIMVRGNVEGLSVLLNNLVGNALRYTQEGGKVDVSASIEQGHPVLRVRDNGPGVPEQERGRLFDRFYRPDGNPVWGCGLGLSIVKNVADLHAADIRLGAGDDGVGFTVAVIFPAEAAAV